MNELWIPIVGIVLGCAIPIVAIIMEHLTKKSKMQVMEKAIEKGITLDGLSLEEKKLPQVPYRSGMIAMAVGIGLGILGILIGQQAPSILYPILGAGAIPTLIGIVLIINDKINYDKLFNKESDAK